MEKLSKGYILPSAAYTLSKKYVKGYIPLDRKPEIGDVAYGRIIRLGEHKSLENGQGRIHNIYKGTKALFVFGHRYAPDAYEGLIPEENYHEVDLMARSGLIGKVITKSGKVIDPTRIELLGYACNERGKVINTRDYSIVSPKVSEKKYPRSKLILVVGTAMNSGKSAAAAACCWTLNVAGREVRAAKITGTASLKDILNMNDAGATRYADFSFMGYPSTYMLEEGEMLSIFNSIDLKYANNKENYWVVELADGINQRETAMLLHSEEVRKRIHKLIFCAADAFGAIGGLEVLKNHFNLVPDAISGVCSSSPLHIKELQQYTDIPIFNSMNIQGDLLSALLTAPKRRSKKLNLNV